MNGDKRPHGADKFVKKHKNLKIWRRLLMITGSIVVFITAYMLILPAITAELSTIGPGFENVLSGSSVSVDEIAVEATTAETVSETTELTTEVCSETASDESTETTTLAPGTMVLDDGTIVQIVVQDQASEGDSESDESAFSNTITMLASDSDSEAEAVAEITYTGSSGSGSSPKATYNATNGDFDVDLGIVFNLSQSKLQTYTGNELTENNVQPATWANYDNTTGEVKCYEFTLPTGVTLADSMIKDDDGLRVYTGYKSGSTDAIFKYFFEKEIVTNNDGSPVTDDNGNLTYKYNVVMVFDKKYITDQNGANINGLMTIESSISTQYLTDSKITVKDDSETVVINIDSNDIEYGNENADHDVTVIKDGSYSAGTGEDGKGTITYTVKVVSRKGTGDANVVINDTMTDFSDFIKKLGGELSSVTYTKGTVGIIPGTETVVTDSTQFSDAVTIPKDTPNTGTVACYTDDGAGKMTITLPPLGDSEDAQYYSNTDSWALQYKKAEAYYVTYTYTGIDPATEQKYTGTNEASVAINDTSAEISDSSQYTVTVTGKKLITKSAKLANNEITWTITVGDDSTSLNGFTLTDDMLSKLTSSDSLRITDEKGTAISPNDYEITYAEDSTTIQSIKFNSDTTKKYVISYNTKAATGWESRTEKNEATITKENEAYSASASQYVPGDNDSNFSKELKSDVTGDGSLKTLTWNIKLTVPEGGIPAGIEFTDVMTDSVSSSEVHYMTYAQANALYATLQEKFGGNLEYVKFYRGTNRYNMTESDWVNADAVSESENYYQFKFKLTNATEYDKTNSNNNDKSFSYSTTADVNITDDTVNYYNEIKDSYNNQRSAQWDYKNRVVKYGIDSSGYRVSGDSKLTVSSSSDKAYVSWMVRVVLDPKSTYTIVDTLPEGVELSMITANANSDRCDDHQLATTDGTALELTDGVYGSDEDASETKKVKLTYISTETVTESTTAAESSSTESSSDSDSTTDDSSETTAAAHKSVVTIEAENLAGAENVLYIKYKCKIDIDSTETTSDSKKTAAGSSEQVFTFPNNVKVTTDTDKEYGSDDQTTTVTWTDEEFQENNLTKHEAYWKNDNKISYSLNINPNSTTYVTSSGESYNEIVINDVLQYYSYPDKGVVRVATLSPSDVKLYYAQTVSTKNADGTTTKTPVYDGDGNLVTDGDPLSKDDYTWTYSTKVESGYAETNTKTLTLTVPNGKALVFKYAYTVNIITDESLVGEGKDLNWLKNSQQNADVTNRATMTIGGETITSDEVITTNKVEHNSTTATADGSTTYTLYKVDEDNFSLPLRGASFTLYMHDTSKENVWDSIGTWSTDSTGKTSLSAVMTSVGDSDPVKKYMITLPTTDDSGNEQYAYIPLNTLCYFQETEAPDGYKKDDTKYYFYFGESIATTLTAVKEADAKLTDDEKTAITENNTVNLASSQTEYITNAHSSEYYAEKTNINVLKKWVDSSGVEINKLDGHIDFKLYRAQVNLAGELVNGSGSSSEGTTETTTAAADYDTITVHYGSSIYLDGSTNKYKYYDYGTAKTIKIKKAEAADVNIDAYATTYYGNVTLYDVTASQIVDGYKEIAFNGATGYKTLEYTHEADSGDRELYVCYSFIDIGNTKPSIVLSSDAEYTTTTTATTTESTTAAEGTTETTTAVLYYHVFNEDSVETTTDDSGKSAVVSASIGYDKTMTKTSDGYSDPEAHSGYFAIFEDDFLSVSSDSTYWARYDVNHDKQVQSSELLKKYLMLGGNSNSPAKITFTAKSDGVLTMVVKAGSSKVTVNKVTIDGTEYTDASSLITTSLEKGVHTIEGSTNSYLYYISFEEGGSDTSSVTVADSEWEHSFDDGLSAVLGTYTIEKDLSIDKGQVQYGTYNGEYISQCLKLNSNADIKFTTPSAGTLVMIIAKNPAYSKVGAVIDGETHYASFVPSIQQTNSLNVYRLTTRIGAGDHEIVRIKSTEHYLYYINFIPDNTGSSSWGGLSLPDSSYYSVYKYGGKETQTISASNDWQWSGTDLPWEIYDDSGNLIGYYVYYVEEIVDENLKDSIVTKYYNNNGVQSGTVGIQNQDTSLNNRLRVVKEWKTDTGADLAENLIPDSLGFRLYSRINVLSGKTYNGGKTETRTFTSGEVSAKAFDTKSQFFDVTADYEDDDGNPKHEYPQSDDSQKNPYGTATYNGVTYENCAKTSSHLNIDFKSPADESVFTVVIGQRNQGMVDQNSQKLVTNPVQRGYGFLLEYYDETGKRKKRYYIDYDIDNNETLHVYTAYKEGEKKNGQKTYYGDPDKVLKFDADGNILNDDGEVVTAKEQYISKITYTDNGDEGIVFHVTLNHAGHYKLVNNCIIHNSNGYVYDKIDKTTGKVTEANKGWGNQNYIFYMDLAYKYSDLADGRGNFVSDYTITDEDKVTDSSGETISWAKEIGGLPYYIYNDNDKDPAAYYSYFIEETSPDTGYTTTITYEQDKTDSKGQTIEVGKTDSNGAYTDITSGIATIVNKKTDTGGVELPETGGTGTNVYTIGGTLLLGGAGFLYIFKRKQRNSGRGVINGR